MFQLVMIALAAVAAGYLVIEVGKAYAAEAAHDHESHHAVQDSKSANVGAANAADDGGSTNND